jgi:2-polyprenyl-3-methyl-5-hydroxy-6-metoxy-1,4-benzoquinol methylase
MEKLDHCPVCGKTSFKEFLNGKDFFLTGQPFTVVECTACGFRFTNPRPDEGEIRPYYESPDYIAHKADKGTLIEAIYKVVRKFALRNKYRIVKSSSSGNKILDIGCGTGEFLHFCKQKGLITTGIEPNLQARNFATGQYGLNVYDETYLKKIPSASFDIITLWHVLEHVHQLKEYLQQILFLLKRDGTLIIALPNSESWDAKTYEQFWAAYDLPRHLYHFTPETLKMLVEKTGFSLSETAPLKIDSFYISLLSEKYKTGSQNFMGALINGLRSNHFAKRHKNNYSSLIYICKIAEESK